MATLQAALIVSAPMDAGVASYEFLYGAYCKGRLSMLGEMSMHQDCSTPCIG